MNFEEMASPPDKPAMKSFFLSNANAIEARKAAIRAICARTSARPEWQGRTSKELQDALYDEDGLPV